MRTRHPFILDVKNKLAIRFGLSFMLVLVFSASSVRFFMDRMESYNKILITQDTKGFADPFTDSQLSYLNQQMSVIKDRLYKELAIANLAVISVFMILSYLLAERLFEPLENALERERNFIADASHELRTPLAAINSVCEVTLRSSKNTTDDYKTALSDVFDESKRLSTTINDLLFLSKGDAQNIKLNIEKVDLVKTVTNITKEMQFVADKKSIQLEIVKSGKEVSVKADKDKLKQLLTILVDNAIKYSKENSKVVLRINEKPEVSLSIQDFGSGIMPNDLPHIFERFYRSDKSRTEEGSGLGLSIAKWIADAHKINIDVRSKPEKGSTFTLKFEREPYKFPLRRA